MQAHITEEIIYVNSHFQRRNHDGHPQIVPLLIFHQTRYEFEPIRSLWLQKNKFEQVLKKNYGDITSASQFISNDQKVDCLLKSLFRLTTKNS